MLDIGYALSRRFPDPPQTDYRSADVRSLRHDLFCGDVYLTDTATGREVDTQWGWVPVLDFAWALRDIADALDRDPLGSRSPGPHQADLDFTESTELLRFTRRFGHVDISADWQREGTPPLTVHHASLLHESREFLRDLLDDLTDLHPDLAQNAVIWTLRQRV